MTERVTASRPGREHAPERDPRRDTQPQHDHEAAISGRSVRLGAAAPPLAPSDAHRLQRAVGNQALARRAASRRPVLQARLHVGPVHDPHEREADRVADAVVGLQGDASIAVAAAIRPLVQRHADHGPACACSACGGVQRHASHDHDHDDELQRHPIQRHAGHDHDHDDELQRHPLQRHAGHDHDDDELQRHAHAHGCACTACSAVQRAPAADGSFTADADLSARVARMTAGGAPLAAPVRGDMETRFGVDLGGVRIHAGGEADALSRDLAADAFTHGRHIAFARGKYDPGSRAGRWLLAHELTHTIQQTGGAGVQRSARIQRHSTHEHYLLGTLKPDELAEIPFVRQQVQKARALQAKEKALEQKANPSNAQKLKKFITKKDVVVPEVEADDGSLLQAEIADNSAEQDEADPLSGYDTERRDEVLHILEAQIEALQSHIEWTAADHVKHQEEGWGKLVGKIEKEDNGHFKVPKVRIPTKGKTSVVCTYGELNTLADMFGSLDDLADTKPEQVVQMLQGVRERSHIVLAQLYLEIGGKKSTLTKKMIGTYPSYWDAIGFTGKQSAPRAIVQYQNATTSNGGITGSFTAANATAALARNACHFAPATWEAWKTYHEKARGFAEQAWAIQHEANATVDGMTATQDKEYRRLVNLALLNNGFGDHFLQDAYAAGHLINKTRVMQWFYQWRKADPNLDNADYAMIDEITEQANLEVDPQKVENTKGTIRKKVEAMNVTIGDHILFLMSWRAKAAEHASFQMVGAKEVGIWKLPFVNDPEATLDKLYKQGFAERTGDGNPYSYRLRDAHLRALAPTLLDKGAYKATKYATDTAGLQASAEEFYYVAYGKFLDRAYLQAITNFLHDTFCMRGLAVKDDDNEDIGVIYGDTTMLTAGGQDGVRHSAETARKSRDAILALCTRGYADDSASDIADRFPHYVEPVWDAVDMKPISIESWWDGLEVECTRAGGLFEQGVNRGKSTLTKRLLKKLTSKEQALTPIHDLDAF